MKNFILLIFVITTIDTFARSDFETKNWKLESKEDGFKIYSKDIKSSDIRALRAVGEIDATLAQITSIMRNVKTATSWVPNLIERSYVEDISDTEAILYDIADMPWPLTDRDTVTKYKLELSKDKKFFILHFKGVEHPKKKETKKYIRAQVGYGKIFFKPRGEKTEVEIIMQIDPKGSIPSWAINHVQVSMPYDFMMALEKFAKKTKLRPRPGIQKLISEMVTSKMVRNKTVKN